jgi:hypothetical protein
MPVVTRVRYFRTQILSKCSSTADHPAAIAEFEAYMGSLGMGTAWTSYFGPHISRLA